jgi:hypothetical protein
MYSLSGLYGQPHALYVVVHVDAAAGVQSAQWLDDASALAVYCCIWLQGQRSMAVARSLGVKLCYGSDLLGALHK